MSGERGAIVAERLAALRTLLDRESAAVLRLDTRRDFCWATLGGLSHVLLATEAAVAPLIVTRDDAVVLAPVNEYARLAEEELDGLPIRVDSLPWWDAPAADRALERLAAGGRVLANRDVADDLESLRSMLAPPEHARLEQLGELAVRAAADALAGVRVGTTEHAIAAAAAQTVARAGARLPVILVAADDRITRYRHPIPTEQVLERRVMIVVVVERWGLHVAHTMFRELQPPDAAQRAARAVLVDVLAAMRQATRPGSSLGDVLAAAKESYAENGAAHEWELHHQGGSIGYGARERIATPGDRTPIRAGMAFAWNPSAVGYKLEETLYLDAAGEQHVVTSTPVGVG